jgi:hypothetical protein
VSNWGAVSSAAISASSISANSFGSRNIAFVKMHLSKVRTPAFPGLFGPGLCCLRLRFCVAARESLQASRTAIVATSPARPGCLRNLAVPRCINRLALPAARIPAYSCMSLVSHRCIHVCDRNCSGERRGWKDDHRP